MFKGLQRIERKNTKPISYDGTTELILDNNYCKKAIPWINDAISDIRICAYAWRWYDESPDDTMQQFNIALVKAINRGVTVRALCERIQEGAILQQYGINVRALNTKRTLHTKAILIDERVLIVGSHNYTRRANLDNFEASIATNDFECIVQFADYFDRLWNDNAKSITTNYGA